MREGDIEVIVSSPQLRGANAYLQVSHPDGFAAGTRIAWDFEGDGTIDETTRALSVAHRYFHLGTSAVEVRVLDCQDQVTAVIRGEAAVRVPGRPLVYLLAIIAAIILVLMSRRSGLIALAGLGIASWLAFGHWAWIATATLAPIPAIVALLIVRHQTRRAVSLAGPLLPEAHNVPPATRDGSEEDETYTDSVQHYFQVSRRDALSEAGFRRFEVVAREDNLVEVVANTTSTFVRLAAVDLLNECTTVLELEPMLLCGEVDARIEPFLGAPDLRLISVSIRAPSDGVESRVHHVIRVRQGLFDEVVHWAGDHQGVEDDTNRRVTWRPLEAAHLAFELTFDAETPGDPQSHKHEVVRYEIPPAGRARKLTE